MSAVAAKRERKPKARRRVEKSMPIQLTVERVVILRTGEEAGAFLPLTRWDQEEMRERRFKVGGEYRAMIEERRNGKFHALSHAVGRMVKDSLTDFGSLSAHGVLKRLQVETGAECDIVEMDASPIVKIVMAVAESMLEPNAFKMLAGALPVIDKIPVKVARSIAYDSMDQSRFEALFAAIFKHLAETYWPEMSPEAVEEMALAYQGQR